MTSTALATPPTAHADEHGPQPPICAEQTPQPAPEADPSVCGALSAACLAGSVALSRQRVTGGLRRLPYLAPDTTAREVAEWFAALREAGARIATIAAETGVSKATVRRAHAALGLTEEVEDGDHDDIYAPDLVAVVVGSSHDEDEQ